jgi:hypothetical protein
MPRELPNSRPTPLRKPSDETKPKPQTPPVVIPEAPGYIPVRQQTDYSDLKLKTLAENVAKLYVPYALKDTRSIDELTVDSLSNGAYLYVDDNGKPSKILAVTVLRKEISWDDLSDDVKHQIQIAAQSSSNLQAGSHITITNNRINAEIGVETINGKTGNVSITAADVGALPISTAIPHKTSELVNDAGFVTSSTISQTINTAIDSIEIDGGNID